MSAAKREGRRTGRKEHRIDPSWPQPPDGSHPVSELAAALQGGLSPYGDVTFPLPADELPYEHPVTKINK